MKRCPTCREAFIDKGTRKWCFLCVPPMNQGRKEWQRWKCIAIRYGIGKQAWEALLAKQDGKCPLCDKEIADTAVVDHDHETNCIRGLLCNGCNIALGKFDSQEWRRRAEKYVGA